MVLQVVAKLTADNLVFLMQVKKLEADLASSNHERSQLRLAVEKQRGPWFDEVCAHLRARGAARSPLASLHVSLSMFAEGGDPPRPLGACQRGGTREAGDEPGGRAGEGSGGHAA